jgi:hypothetical protein
MRREASPFCHPGSDSAEGKDQGEPCRAHAPIADAPIDDPVLMMGAFGGGEDFYVVRSVCDHLPGRNEVATRTTERIQCRSQTERPPPGKERIA